MQGRLLTEADLEAYFEHGERWFRSPTVPSCDHNWQHPRSITLNLDKPSEHQSPSVSSWHNQSQMLEAHQPGSGTNYLSKDMFSSHQRCIYHDMQQDIAQDCLGAESATVVEEPIYGSTVTTPKSCIGNKLPENTITDEKTRCSAYLIALDSMSEANIWSRMVMRPSLKCSRRRMCHDMQQDVLNVAWVDDSLSAESATVVEGPIYGSVLTPISYLGDKLPEKTITDEKAICSTQFYSTSFIESALGVETEEKGRGLKKHTHRKACFPCNVGLKQAWNRLRCWTAAALTQVKNTARLPSAFRPIR